MSKQFVHVKLPEGFFELVDPEDAIDRNEFITKLIRKIERSGEYLAFATDQDLKFETLEGEDLLVTIEELITTAFLDEKLRAGVLDMAERILKQLKGCLKDGPLQS